MGRTRQKSTVATFLACLALSAAPAKAGSPPPPSGIIVSIRGNILEIQPAWLTGHERLMVDNNTKVVENSDIPLASIPVGTRMEVFGRGDVKSGLTAHYVIAGDLSSLGFSGKLIGVTSSQWGVRYGGVLKSAAPFVVTDDAGTDITASPGHVRTAQFARNASLDDILIGRKISYASDRDSGGIMHVTNISIDSEPGKPGVLYATVVACHGDRLTVVPRFGSTPADIDLAPLCRIERQVTLDDDLVKKGDVVSAWGIAAQSRGGGSGLVAFALMRGVKTFPIASTEPGAPDRSVTGIVQSLTPFTLKVDHAPLPVYVTGQTPLVNFAPSSPGQLRKGDMVMLLVARGPKGGMITNYILVDASPILAFAFAY